MLEDLICRGHSLSRVKGRKLALTTAKVSRRILGDAALRNAYLSICGGAPDECLDNLPFAVRNHMVHLAGTLKGDPVGKALRVSLVRTLTAEELDRLCVEIVERYDPEATEPVAQLPRWEPVDEEDEVDMGEIEVVFNGKPMKLSLR